MSVNSSDERPNHAALFTDLYELTMLQSYLKEGMTGTAVFELFFRRLPDDRNFLVAAGLQPLLQMLEELCFTSDQLTYLRSQNLFSEEFLEALAGLTFTGDVWAVPEGTVIFPQEPLVQVIASLPEAQLIETLVLNQIHFASIAPPKALGWCWWLTAGGSSTSVRGVRTGANAASTVAGHRTCQGCDGTSLVEAGHQYGIPIFRHDGAQLHPGSRRRSERLSGLHQ